MDVLGLLDVLLSNLTKIIETCFEKSLKFSQNSNFSFTGSHIQKTNPVDSNNFIEKLIRNYELNYQNQRIL